MGQGRGCGMVGGKVLETELECGPEKENGTVKQWEESEWEKG